MYRIRLLRHHTEVMRDFGLFKEVDVWKIIDEIIPDEYKEGYVRKTLINDNDFWIDYGSYSIFIYVTKEKEA